MNNRYPWILTLILAAALGVVGCAKSDQPDLARLTKTFAAADPSVKEPVNRAVVALRAKDLSTALRVLNETFKVEGLTSEQKQTLSETITRIALQLDKTGRNTEQAQATR
jgi:hypothetical protein